MAAVGQCGREAGEAHNLRRRRVRDRGVVEIQQTHAVAVGTLATSRHALRRGGPQPSRAAWRCLALCIRGRASRLVNLGPHHRVDRSLPGGPSSPALSHTRGIGVGTPSCPCRPVFSCLTGCTESIPTDVLPTVAAKNPTKPPVQANASPLASLTYPLPPHSASPSATVSLSNGASLPLQERTFAPDILLSPGPRPVLGLSPHSHPV